MSPLATLFKRLLFSMVLIAGALPVAYGQLELEPCRILGADGTRQQPARCGTLSVPLDYAKPDGGQLDLFVAVVSARSREPAPDALAIIAGGPGAASTAFYADRAHSFHFANKTRDIVLVDQRGTGQSNALDCPPPDELALNETWSLDLVRDISRECLESLNSDPRFFTTSVAVKDLEAVRAALGYPSLSIYGASYGTRVAQHYLRRYPDSTRAVILDGVVAPDTLLVPGIPVHAQKALELIFARCDQDDACATRFPKTLAAFNKLHRQLETTPEDVSFADPHSGETVEFSFSHLELSGVVRLLSYSPETAALLPLMISAADNGDLGPLAAQTLIALKGVSDLLSYGMHNAVACSEDAPRVTAASVDRATLDKTYLGSWFVDGFVASCEDWPAGDVDPDFFEPVESDKPVLLLSGGADPATPAINAEQAAIKLSNSRHLVQTDHGHGLLTLPCVARLMGDFIESPDPELLEADCLSEHGPPPFFIDFSGPEP